MPVPSRLAIVGASLAGSRLVRALRRKGFDGQVVMVGAEEHLPYDRPPLSKQFLAGTTDVDGIRLARDGTYDGVELRLGVPATRLDPRERRVELADGSSVVADDVVVATGSAPRRLPGQQELDGLFVLRTLDDSVALRDTLQPGARLVVVGAGFIGSEVASTARGRDVEVTVLEADEAPVVRGVGPVVGRALARLHIDAGVDLRTSTGVTGIVGERGRVTGVGLADGTTVPADVVLVGIGAVPVTGWLDGAGLALDDGVATDERCRAVGGGGHVWAIGDVARWPSGRYGAELRIEHWTNATEHATTLAANLLGGEVGHDPIPYVWSDQFGHKVQALGNVRPDDTIEVLSGDLEDDRWVVGYLRDGGLAGVVGIDQPRAVMTSRSLIQGGASLDEVRAHVEATT